MNLFVFGLGYSALHYVRAHRNSFDRIAGTVRTQDKCAALRSEGCEGFVMNSEEADPAIASMLGECDAWLVSIAPDARGDPVLIRLQTLSLKSPPQRIVYLSTIGVYGDHRGAWVDESTPPKPASQRSRWRLAAENRWIEFARAHGSDLHILRFAGIYGPGRSALDNLRQGKARRIVKKDQVFNRIHVVDIAQTIATCFSQPLNDEAQIWNVTDNEPSPPQDVVTYAAELLGVEPPPAISFEDADMTPMARSFYGENKRVSNHALRERLGVKLRYPTYREGLKHLLNQPK